MNNSSNEAVYILNPKGVVRQVSKELAQSLVDPNKGKPGYSIYTAPDAEQKALESNHTYQKKLRRGEVKAAKPAAPAKKADNQ